MRTTLTCFLFVASITLPARAQQTQTPRSISNSPATAALQRAHPLRAQPAVSQAPQARPATPARKAPAARPTQISAGTSTGTSAIGSEQLIGTLQELQLTYRRQALLLRKLMPQVPTEQQAELQMALQRAQSSRQQLSTQLQQLGARQGKTRVGMSASPARADRRAAMPKAAAAARTSRAQAAARPSPIRGVRPAMATTSARTAPSQLAPPSPVQQAQSRTAAPLPAVQSIPTTLDARTAPQPAGAASHNLSKSLDGFFQNMTGRIQQASGFGRQAVAPAPQPAMPAMRTAAPRAQRAPIRRK